MPEQGVPSGDMSFIVFSLAASVFLQEPSSGVQRGLESSDPGYRLASAQDLATLGDGASRWLKKQLGKGSPARQRALLLAAVLIGSDDAFEVLEKASGLDAEHIIRFS